MLNLFSFFRQQATHWRQDSAGRSAEYVAGGVAALREACDTLTAHKDVVDMELLSQQLAEAHRESRELRATNKGLDDARRSFQSKHDLLAKELARVKEQLAALRATGPPARDELLVQLQSQADRQVGQWQSIAANLRAAFYELCLVLTKQELSEGMKIQQMARILSKTLVASQNGKHRRVADWLDKNLTT